MYAHVSRLVQDSLEGVRVIPFPLFEVLNGKNTGEYVARVEPSSTGGELMGSAFVRRLEEEGVLTSPSSTTTLHHIVDESDHDSDP